MSTGQHSWRLLEPPLMPRSSRACALRVLQVMEARTVDSDSRLWRRVSTTSHRRILPAVAFLTRRQTLPRESL